MLAADCPAFIELAQDDCKYHDKDCLVGVNCGRVIHRDSTKGLTQPQTLDLQNRKNEPHSS
jgi:hypothetical protein